MLLGRLRKHLCLKPRSPYAHLFGFGLRSLLTCHSRNLGTASQVTIGKILIANRGEIACRVIRTARKLGLQTVAVYSEADKHSLHVQLADESVCIGPAPAQYSYLNGPAILDASKRTQAHAIHPGYGFLSENALFAELCEKESITFIGPPINAIRVMGDKSESKSLMSAAGVPVVPGYHGEEQSAVFLKSQADMIGYPVIIKATQGGGGKGMKIVSRPDDFVDNLLSAQREALTAFGDQRVLVEKYILEPRHIEVQVFGDQHGNVVHLFERDCSVQRRHQKIIEEAPAPNISEELRKHLGQAAVNAAKAVGYYSAGTVEFIVDSLSEDFFFMEMNTRLQVEHPVTEMVTKQDLVEWQIRVASGEPLPCGQSDLSLSGHAFEARIYAENVVNGFLPAAGVLHHYRPPDVSSSVRVETGVEEGDSVTIHYDPMIAKLVVWGHNRSAALVKLQDCLSKFQVSGTPTNISFLKRLSLHDAFSAGEVGTHFIERHKDSLLVNQQQSMDIKHSAALAAVCICIREMWISSKDYSESCKVSVGKKWALPSGFRLNHELKRHIQFEFQQESQNMCSLEVEITVTYCRDGSFVVEMSESDSSSFTVRGEDQQMDSHRIKLTINGITSSVSASFYKKDAVDHVDVWYDGRHHQFCLSKQSCTTLDHTAELLELQGQPKRTSSLSSGSVVAPMAGRIVRILAEDGQKVKKGDPLLILEAMKMEHVVQAPREGLIQGVKLETGQHINDSSVLFFIIDKDELTHQR